MIDSDLAQMDDQFAVVSIKSKTRVLDLEYEWLDDVPLARVICDDGKEYLVNQNHRPPTPIETERLSLKPYYVYIFAVGDRPLYVGKGKGGRALTHLSQKDWARQEGVEAKIFFCDSERQALDREAMLIAHWRPKREGGLLHNVARPRLATLDEVFLSQVNAKLGIVEER